MGGNQMLIMVVKKSEYTKIKGLYGGQIVLDYNNKKRIW